MSSNLIRVFLCIILFPILAVLLIILIPIMAFMLFLYTFFLGRRLRGTFVTPPPRSRPYESGENASALPDGEACDIECEVISASTVNEEEERTL